MACKDAVKLIESLRKGTLVEYLSNISTELCNHIGETTNDKEADKAIQLDYIVSGIGGRISSLFTKDIPKGRYVAKSMGCRTDYSKIITYDNGVYKFIHPFYMELIIGLIVSMLIDGYNNIMCKNFVKILTFTLCKDRCYIFMSMETMTLYELINQRKRKLTDSEIDYYVFQILFAVVAYRQAFDIVHGDFHPGNVFLKEQRNDNKTYYKYTLNGKEYYVPSGEYIVKIGDWGLSYKFAKPAIVGMSFGDDEETYLKYEYKDTYDSIRILLNLYMLLGKKSQHIIRLTRYMLRLDDIEHIDLAEYLNYETPKCKLVRSPNEILGDMFDMYTTLPPTGSKIVIMGKV